MKRWALVTGSARRLGRSFSLALAKAEYDLILHSFRSGEEAATLAKEIRSMSRRVELVTADLSVNEGVDKVVRFVNERCGSLELLINNASVWVNPESLDGKMGIARETLSNFDHTMAVNLRAPFFLLQGLLPLLKQASPGVVVNMLDGSVTDPYTTRASHSLSKAALMHLIELTARTYPKEILAYGLELGAILPPDQLGAGERAGVEWIGAESAVNALLELLRKRPQTATITKVSGPRHC